MQIVKISNDNMDLLSSVINKIVLYYSKFDIIEALYMICFNSRKNNIDNLDFSDENIIKPAINITLVYNNYDSENDLDDFYFELKKIKEITGVDILITKTIRANYGLCLQHREIIACKNLVNASILFDRKNEYSKLKERLESYNFYKHYDDLIEFEPFISCIKKYKY